MNRFVFTLISTALLSACSNGDDAYRFVGQLESDRIEIAAEVSEPITEKLVAEGQAVTVGTVLMTQNTDRIEASVKEAESALALSRARLAELVRGPREEQIAATRAALEGAEHELEFRTTEYERAENLLAQSLASTSNRDSAKAALEAARANQDSLQAQLEELLTGTTPEELDQAQAAVEQAEARLSSLQINLARHHLTAPADALVDSILFEPGERPAVGMPVLVLLGGQPYARVYVAEGVRAQLKAGDKARIHVDGIDTAFDGRVRWISNDAAFTPYFALTERDRGRLTYLAKIDLLNVESRLPDGIPVEVEIARPANE